MNQRSVLDYGLLFMLTFIWGSSFILYKEALLVLSWEQVGLLRITIAALCFVPFAPYWWSRTDKDKLKSIAAVGLFGSGIPPFLFALAQTELESGLTGVLNTLTPIFTLVIGLFFFGYVINRWKTAGLILGLVGAAIIILFDPNKEMGGNGLFGGYVVLATIFYALSTNIIKSRLQFLHPMTIGVFAMLFILIPAAIALPFFGIYDTLRYEDGALEAFGYVTILGVFCTALANLLYFKLVQRTDIVFASTLTYMIPIVAIGWGLLDGERFLPTHFLGMGLILIGIWLTGKK